MADRSFFSNLGSLDAGIVFLGGVVALTSAGAVSTITGLKGMTVAKTGTGQYTFTFADPYVAGLVAPVELMSTSATPLWAQVSSYDPVSAKTMVVQLVNNAGTATDVSAPGFSLSVLCVLKNSTA